MKKLFNLEGVVLLDKAAQKLINGGVSMNCNDTCSVNHAKCKNGGSLCIAVGECSLHPNGYLYCVPH